MVRQWWKQGALASALCGAASLVAAQEAVPGVQFRLAEPSEGTVVVAQEITQGNPLVAKANQNKYWIGVSCNPINEALQAQLNRPHGLLVEAVVEDSPAAKANLRVHDILLKLNDAELTTIEQLLDVVEKHGAREVTLTLLRGGKEEAFKVTIVERPQTKELDAEAESKRQQAFEKGLRWLQDQNKEVELMFVRPGVAFAPDRIKATVWPKDVTVKFLKEGEQPATIEIKRGDKTWKVTEDKLGELPDDIRVLVEQMRGGAMKIRLEGQPGIAAGQQFHLYNNAGATPIRIQATPVVPGASATGSARIAVAGGNPGVVLQRNSMDDVHKKLDTIIKRLPDQQAFEKLEQEVDRLRRDLDALREQLRK